MAILTVYTKLLDKTLEGARIIDMGSTKTCECFVLPRDLVAEVGKKHKELNQYAFYILLGKDKNGNPQAYIGETNDFTNRVNDHKQKKDWWDTALVFVSKANEIFSSEVLYLEYIGWEAACSANNFVIANTKDIKEPSLSPDKKNDMELFFEEIQFLTRFYGCSVFDVPKIEKESNPDYEVLFLNMPKSGINATVHYYPQTKTFILKEGSSISSKNVKSASKESMAKIKAIRNDSTLSKLDGDVYRILKDIDITSEKRLPSGPAGIITGTSMQGTTAFKNKDGVTFEQLFPKS